VLFPKSAANHTADLDFGSSGTETLSLEIVFIGSSSPSATLSGMVFSVAYYA
jgi:hypothetical protein